MQITEVKISDIKPYSGNDADKWVCKKCGHERYDKPHKNEVCECKGRYIHYRKCVCGKYFLVTKNQKYCSAECRGYELSERQKPIKLICDVCGKEFLRYVGNVDENAKHNFCSKECKNKFYEGNKLLRVCKQCGKQFYVYETAINKTNASGNFCSRECYWKSMIKLRKGYSGFATAKRLFFKNKQVCAICGATENIHIHHIIPNRLTQDQSKSNLIPLCAKHHIQVENATRDLLETITDYDLLKVLLNNILRQKQAVTYTKIMRLQNAVKN